MCSSKGGFPLRPKNIKQLSAKHWAKVIRVAVHNLGKAIPEQIILGLDVMNEVMRADGDFGRQHALPSNIVSAANDFLPLVFLHAEQNVGVDLKRWVFTTIKHTKLLCPVP